MTAEVLPQVLSGESHAGLSPLKIWDLLIRLIRRFTLSNEELQLLEIVRGAAATIGRPVLSASSLEDLDSKLDQFVSSPELLKIVQQSARALTLSSLEAALTAPTISPEFVAVLGAGPAKKLEQFFPLVGAAVSVMFQHFTISPECWIEGPNEEQFANILYNPELPLQVRKCLFAGLRADVASLAVAAALMGDQVRIPLEPWLAQALVEQMVRGQYERVRLLAAIPDSVVPLSVLPLEDRLDPAALDAESSAQTATIEEWLASARVNDADVFFPEGDVGDSAG